MSTPVWPPSAARYAPLAAPERNIALDARVSSPDGVPTDVPGADDEMSDRYACDGLEATYWDEKDNAGEYRLRLDLERASRPRVMELVGFRQEEFAPRSFEVLSDGKVLKTVTDLRYRDNLARVQLPGKPCRRLELRITAWYGGSPAIRELRLYE